LPEIAGVAGDAFTVTVTAELTAEVQEFEMALTE
jgi:hypothetical protein